MNIKNDQYMDHIRLVFEKANFVNEVGIRLLGCGPGWCETELSVEDRHLQQNGVLHAGVQATMADHTAGAAAATLVAADEVVLTLEFKINFLRPAVGDRITCRADVIKPGSSFTVVESGVYAVTGEAKKLVAKAQVTIAVIRPGE